jgi:hypothetical protein
MPVNPLESVENNMDLFVKQFCDDRVQRALKVFPFCGLSENLPFSYHPPHSRQAHKGVGHQPAGDDGQRAHHDPLDQRRSHPAAQEQRHAH